jgi:hypothetical protein
MSYLCLECFEAFKEDRITYKNNLESFNPCPRSKCCGEVIEVDELFLPIIKVLNQKGYITTFCCSGHITDNICSSYIAFDDEVILPNLPPMYQYDKDKYPHVDWSKYPNGTRCIRRDMIRKNEAATFNELLKNAKNVLKWAKKLPDNIW